MLGIVIRCMKKRDALSVGVPPAAEPAGDEKKKGDGEINPCGLREEKCGSGMKQGRMGTSRLRGAFRRQDRHN